MVRVFRLVGLGVLLALAGCGGSGSNSEVNNGFSATITAVNEGDLNTTLIASFKTGGARDDALVLTAVDQLIADDGLEVREMEPFEVAEAISAIFTNNLSLRLRLRIRLIIEVLFGGDIFGEPEDLLEQLRGSSGGGLGIYTTTFVSSTGDYTVSLSQADGISAPENTLSLPVGFNIEMPATNQRFGYDEEVTFVWANDDVLASGGSMNITFFADCELDGNLFDSLLVPISGMGVEDNGVVTISVVDMFGSALDRSKGCDLRAELSRDLSGQLDPIFQNGGRITASQVRSVEYRVTADGFLSVL